MRHAWHSVQAEKDVDDLEYVDGRLKLFPEAREIAACVPRGLSW